MTGTEQSPLQRRLDAVLAFDANARALAFESQWITWGQLREAVTRIEHALDAAGIAADGRVGVLLRNRPAIVAAMLAVLHTGRTLVSLSPSHPAERLAGELRELRLPVLIGDVDDWRHEALRTAARGAGTAAMTLPRDLAAPVAFVEGLERSAGRHRPASPGIALEMLTSGTTGTPKRVQRTYAAMSTDILVVAVPDGQLDRVSFRPTPTIVAAPLVHVSGLSGVLWPVCETRPIVLLEKFEALSWARAVHDHGIRYASLPPAAVRMVLDAGIPREMLQGLSAVRSGTAPLPPETQQAFEDRYGVPILVQYGATELAGIAAWSIDDHRRFRREKAGSVGRAVRGNRIRIVDPESGDVLPAGEIGLLEAMLPESSDPSRQWIRTTDRARMDEDGFIYIHGRADDVIIRGGFKVPLNAVAAAMMEHPDVLEASAVALPDARLGQVPAVAVEMKSGCKPLTASELEHFARERLPPYQVPVAFKALEALPRTPSMKVSLVEVRRLFGVE